MNPFLSFYAMTNRLGLLNLPGMQTLFRKAYFTYKAFLEDPFTPLVRRRPDLFKGGHILDVGANIGYTAALFAKVLAPGFRVYAFEPEARNVQMLKTSIDDLGLSGRIIPIQAAIGDHDGKAQLWLNPAHHADHRMVTPTFKGDSPAAQETQEVPVMRLDSFCARELPGAAVGFIKIDVQGYEECVCRGMEQTLVKNPQAVVGLEYYPHGFDVLGFKAETLLRFFQEREYRVFVLTRRDGVRPTSYDKIQEAMGPAGYIDLLFLKSGTILDSTFP